MKKAKEMAFHMNTLIFGKPDKPVKYKVPLDPKTAELGEVSFNDCWAQKIEVEFSELIPLFLKESDSHPRRWLASTSRLSSILLKLKQKEDFTDNQICCLQDEIDVKSEDWIALCGREGMTNYSHILTGTHIICFFKTKMAKSVQIFKSGMGLSK
jgi:hypothetical protein